MADVREAVADYLAGGDEEPFDGQDPFAIVPGGVDAVTDALAAVTDDLALAPQNESAYAALLVGRMCAVAKLEKKARAALETYMLLGRASHYKHFRDGIKMAEDEVKSEETGKGGVIPSESEQREIQRTTGMQWVEAVALRHAMLLGPKGVLTSREARELGWDADVTSTDLFKNRKKYGVMTHKEMEERPAAEYSEWLDEIETQLVEEKWHIAGATVGKLRKLLAKMTIERGAPELFVNYMKHHNKKKSRTMSSSAPLDEALLSLHVLSVKGSSVAEYGFRGRPHDDDSRPSQQAAPAAERVEAEVHSLAGALDVLGVEDPYLPVDDPEPAAYTPVDAVAAERKAASASARRLAPTARIWARRKQRQAACTAAARWARLAARMHATRASTELGVHMRAASRAGWRVLARRVAMRVRGASAARAMEAEETAAADVGERIMNELRAASVGLEARPCMQRTLTCFGCEGHIELGSMMVAGR